MAVSHDDVRRIAALARLAVPAEELDAFAAELSGILAHMDALAEVETTGIPDATEHAEGMRLADDRGPPVPMARGPQAIAPEWRDGFFLVPRLATHEGLGATEGDAG